MKIILRYLILVFLLAGCEEETNWPLQTGNNNQVVVDGTITDDKRIQVIHLTNTVDNLNTIPAPVTGATVIITLEDSVYNFTESPVNPGTYFSNTAFAGKKNKVHSLLVTHGSNLYSAKANMEPGVLVFPDLKYVLDNESKLFHISKVYFSEFNPVKPAMFEILLDWSQVAGYQDTDPRACKARLLYYVLPTLDVSQVFAPETGQVNFPQGTIIVENRYSLTTGHAAFFRELLSETTWQGGFFNSAAANIPTNLSQGAIGYFGACAVNTRTEVAKP
jgi:hypothetical protein